MKKERKGLNINRQQFAKYIERPDEYSKDHDLGVRYLRKAHNNQVDFILEDVECKYTMALYREPEYPACYSGGSIEFKEDMHKQLKEFADSVDATALWIPEQYAVDMNVKRLDILNRNMLFTEEYEGTDEFYEWFENQDNIAFSLHKIVSHMIELYGTQSVLNHHVYKEMNRDMFILKALRGKDTLMVKESILS